MRQHVTHDTSTIADGLTALQPKFAIIDHASSGDNTLVSAVAGKRIRVLNIVMVVSGTVTIRFESGASGTGSCLCETTARIDVDELNTVSR